VNTEPGPRQLAAWRALLETHARVVEALETELLAERGLPLAWYDILVQLSEAPRVRLRMRELAGAVLLSKSGLTRLVDRMEAAGLVARKPCASDRRGTFVGLTPAGMRALRGAAPVHLRGIERHFGRYLDEGEAARFEAMLGKVVVGRAHPG